MRCRGPQHISTILNDHIQVRFIHLEILAANPDDHQARFDLAQALYAHNEREAAANELLEIVRRQRDWNEEAARKQLLKYFEAWGFKDPATQDARRRLSSLLFA